MANIFTETSLVESSTERDLREYVVPLTPEDEELVHNLEVLKNISDSGTIPEEGVLDGVRIGRESYSIKPTEVYTINNEGGKVFVTGKPDSANRIAFYAYQTSPDNTLGGIDASPYLDVHKVELIMTRKTAKRDIKPDSKNPFQFVHSYPQINVDILFVDWGYGNIPNIFFFNPTGERTDIIGWKNTDLHFVEYGDYPVVAMGRRNEGKPHGDRMAHEKLLGSIRKFSNIYGGLQPKDAYLQLTLTEDEEYESNFVISL